MKYNTGISLMEFLIALSVIAILSSVGIPSFLGTIENNRLRGAGEELYSKLFAARSEAINEHKTLYVSFNTGTTWCFGIDTTGYCDCTNPASCNTGTVTNKNNKVALTVNGFTNNQNQISSSKGMFATSGSVSFASNGKSVTVNVAQLGRIRICSSTIAGYKPC